MTKRLGVFLAVGLIAVVVGMLAVGYDRHSSSLPKRVGINSTEQSRNNLGMSADLDLLYARTRWLSDGVIRITPTLGVNFGLLKPYTSATNFARSFKVSTSTILSDEDFGSTTKHRYSYETGIRVYLSLMQYVGISYGKRYEGDSVTISFETELRL